MDEKESLKHSNKIKSKVSSLRQKAVDLEKPVDQVKLPNVALPISTLPKFDFSLPPPLHLLNHRQHKHLKNWRKHRTQLYQANLQLRLKQ